MGSETLPLKHAFTLCPYPAGPHFAAKRAAAMDVNTAEASLPEPPDTPDFTDLLEFTLPATLPANPDDTPEIRARKLASAQRQFAAFQPTDEADAQEAIAAIAANAGGHGQPGSRRPGLAPEAKPPAAFAAMPSRRSAITPP